MDFTSFDTQPLHPKSPEGGLLRGQSIKPPLGVALSLPKRGLGGDRIY
jgi:hypothetical protein